jgi:hypothetical protein
MVPGLRFIVYRHPPSAILCPVLNPSVASGERRVLYYRKSRGK